MPNRLLAILPCLLLTACGDPPPLQTQTVKPTPSPAAAVFPLRVSDNSRYLVDRHGRPFLMHGDTAWSLIVQPTREDVLHYLEDRRARGFNTLLMNLVEHKFADNAPANRYGDAPFLRPGDFSTPNEAYFEHADWVLDRAREMGFAVLLVPAYLGYRGGDQGWYQTLITSRRNSLRQYGRFLGERYRDMDHIIWVHGGDYNPPRRETVTLIAEALHEVLPDRLATAHCGRETSAAEFWGNESWLTLNNAYTRRPIYEASLREYFRPGPMPFFFIEGLYENRPGTEPVLARIQAYYALLSGAAGHMFGNYPIWHYDGPGLYEVAIDWREALDGPGSRSMAILWQLFSGLEWWKLVPDTDHKLLQDGLGDDWERAVAALAGDGSFAVAYIPEVREVALDPGALSGPRIALEWFDPTDGSWHSAAKDSPDGTQLQRLTPPGPNSVGDGDWILVARALDDRER